MSRYTGVFFHAAVDGRLPGRLLRELLDVMFVALVFRCWFP